MQLEKEQEKLMLNRWDENGQGGVLRKFTFGIEDESNNQKR